MRARFLGTGCGGARIKKFLSKDYRRSPSLLLDEVLLVDPGPDVFAFESDFGLSGLTAKVTDVFVTHTHEGHLSRETVERLAKKHRVRVFGSGAAGRIVADLPNVEFHTLSPFSPVDAGDYRVTPLPSVHETDEPCEPVFSFLIERDSRLLYAPDGAFIDADAFRYLKSLTADKKAKFRVGCAVIDCAVADLPLSVECCFHNDVETAKRLCDFLLQEKIFDEETKVFLTHVPSSKKRSIHDDLSERVAEYGFKVAHDGYFFGF